jgi:hypothetical protein
MDCRIGFMRPSAAARLRRLRHAIRMPFEPPADFSTVKNDAAPKPDCWRSFAAGEHPLNVAIADPQPPGQFGNRAKFVVLRCLVHPVLRAIKPPLSRHWAASTGKSLRARGKTHPAEKPPFRVSTARGARCWRLGLANSDRQLELGQTGASTARINQRQINSTGGADCEGPRTPRLSPTENAQHSAT